MGDRILQNAHRERPDQESLFSRPHVANSVTHTKLIMRVMSSKPSAVLEIMVGLREFVLFQEMQIGCRRCESVSEKAKAWYKRQHHVFTSAITRGKSVQNCRLVAKGNIFVRLMKDAFSR